MAFPSTAGDWQTHSEGVLDYYGRSGKWYRKRYPQFAVHGGPHADENRVAAGHTNFTLWFPEFTIDRPRNMIVARAAFRPSASCDVYLAMVDWDGNSWVPKSKFLDPSGMVRWGEGGVGTTNWESFRAFNSNSFWVNSSEASRKLRQNRPQLIRLWVMKNGVVNACKLAWQYHGQCVTYGVAIRTYGKMELNMPIENIKALHVALSDGTFEDGRFSAEIY